MRLSLPSKRDSMSWLTPDPFFNLPQNKDANPELVIVYEATISEDQKNNFKLCLWSNLTYAVGNLKNEKDASIKTHKRNAHILSLYIEENLVSLTAIMI